MRTRYELEHPADCFCRLRQKPAPASTDRLPLASEQRRPPLNPRVQKVQRPPPPPPKAGDRLAASGRLRSPRVPARSAPPTAGAIVATSPGTRRPAVSAAAAAASGSPASGVACAALCEVQGDHSSQGLLHAVSHFLVIVRDVHGHRIRRGGDKVRVSSRGPGPLRPSVSDVGDGSYRVSYQATLSGRYALR